MVLVMAVVASVAAVVVVVIVVFHTKKSVLSHPKIESGLKSPPKRTSNMSKWIVYFHHESVLYIVMQNGSL